MFMTNEQPTIKGIFVTSHIKALEKQRGHEAVEELERRYGKPLRFRSSDNVPIAEENLILSHIVDITSATDLKHEERAFEAGRVHMKNFSTTPMWLLLSPALQHSPKWIFLQSQHVAELVFEGVKFSSREVSPTVVQIRMEDHEGSYPIEHFQGFLAEMISASGLVGAVDSGVAKDGAYIYTITWVK
jgi:uncharacterized protein (TIGR02265 family)